MVNKKIAILGSGGHAKVLSSILEVGKQEIEVVVSRTIPIEGSHFYKFNHVDDEYFLKHSCPEDFILLNGIGALPNDDRRWKIATKYSQAGFRFLTIIDKSAIVHSSVQIGEGVQILTGSIIQPGTIVGDQTIVNTRSVIDHDCQIGGFNHIAPGVVMSGGVKTAEYVHIGTGASIGQQVKIGKGTNIGAGCSVVKNIGDWKTVLPAKVRVNHNEINTMG